MAGVAKISPVAKPAPLRYNRHMANGPHTTGIRFDAKTGTLALTGALTVREVAGARARIAAHKPKRIDLTQLATLDTAGAYFLLRWADGAPIDCADDEQRQLLERIAALEVGQLPEPQTVPPMVAMVEGIGRRAVEAKRESVRVVAFAGEAAVKLVRAFTRRRELRLGAIAQHIHAIGIEAMPIIGLMAFLISVVLAYQGVAQLRPYGGEPFTVNLVALSILREMGVLLTAIMVAGRSGSAFTAEIGVMKAREEVDALAVMGLRPFAMLVTPRLVAIVIALPLLTFFANAMGLIGGFVICHSLIDITLHQYIERVHMAAGTNDLLVGLIKAPVFAFAIGIVGCMHGLRVSGSAESIGRETTAAVVKSIFLVLVLDAFFSILFEEVGL